jgi:hypothetical protein
MAEDQSNKGNLTETDERAGRSDHSPGQRAVDLGAARQNFSETMRALGDVLAPLGAEARRQAKASRRIDDLMETPESGMTTQELLAVSERYAVRAMQLEGHGNFADTAEAATMSQALSALAAARIALYGSGHINAFGGRQ